MLHVSISYSLAINDMYFNHPQVLIIWTPTFSHEENYKVINAIPNFSQARIATVLYDVQESTQKANS